MGTHQMPTQASVRVHEREMKVEEINLYVVFMGRGNGEWSVYYWEVYMCQTRKIHNRKINACLLHPSKDIHSCLGTN